MKRFDSLTRTEIVNWTQLNWKKTICKKLKDKIGMESLKWMLCQAILVVLDIYFWPTIIYSIKFFLKTAVHDIYPCSVNFTHLIARCLDLIKLYRNVFS